MFTLKAKIKKIGTTIFTSIMLCFAFVPAARAQGGSIEYYLGLIASYTHDTLEKVNDLPDYLNKLAILASNWQQPDTSKNTAAIQGMFTSNTQATITNLSSQLALQQRLVNDFFGQDVNSSSVPYANDMVYSTLLGTPLYNPDPRKEKDKSVDPAYNYVKNIAGLNLKHVIPDDTWRGKPSSKDDYKAFYQTINAIQTYNAYTLSEQYVEAMNNYQPLGVRLDLIQEASKPDWFTQVASESIGVVLRQILLFNSQIYVVLTEMLQTQRQILTTMAMSNTLFIMGNQFTESQLIAKATGKMQ